MSERREHVEEVSALTDEERQIERLLAALAPRDSRINRDRTIFLAGHASGLSQAQKPPKRRWIWPALTAGSAAAGLLLGVLFVASSKSPPVVAPQTPADVPVAQRSIGPERQKLDREASFVDSPALLERRVAMLSRAGDEFLLTGADPLSSGERPKSSLAGSATPFAPMTYGALLGRLHEEEKHL